jgi:diacylglycerol kinase family enzyme
MRNLILVNKRSNSGKAALRWPSLRNRIYSRLDGFVTEADCPPAGEILALVKDQLKFPEPLRLIYAGGDGTLHYIINDLMNLRSRELKRIAVGGIGLGTSNDFCKPCKSRIDNVPLRLDFSKLLQSDVGVIEYNGKHGERTTRYFILNSGCGVVANANAFFSSNDLFLCMTRKHFRSLAIAYTALRTILFHRNIPLEIRYNGTWHSMHMSNLNAIKSPYISGDFKYDSSVDPGNGFLGIRICDNMTRWQLMKTLYDMTRDCFSGKNNRVSFESEFLEIRSEHPIIIEADGELYPASEARFGIIPRAIRLAQP